MADSSSAARCADPTPSAVERAAAATPVTFSAISDVPCAASWTLRPISLVVAACSSAADPLDGLHRARRLTLDRRDLPGDLLGGRARRRGQLLDLVGDDREPLPRV